MKKPSYILILSLIFISCGKSYDIDKESLELSYKIDHGFEIYQLDVTEFDSENNPKEYEQTSIVHCVPNNHPSTERFDKVVPKKTAELYRDSWKKQREIAERNGNKIDDKTNNKDMDLFIKTELARDSIMKKYFPFEPDDEIYFNKENKNYWWRTGNYTSEDLKEFPHKFKDEVWYKIEFSNQNCYTDDFFFKFKKNGTVKTNHKEGNCGAAW